MRLLLRLLAMVSVLALWQAGADAADRVGVLLLHGKTGMPGQMKPLEAALTAAGYIVGAPEMCWSKRRIYDHDLAGCFADIDAAIGRIKAEGATTVVLGGTSMGAMASLGYAASHAGLVGVIGIVPAGDPIDLAHYPAFAAALKQATALVKAGKGDVPVALDDLVTGAGMTGADMTVTATPDAYLSFHGPQSPIATVLNNLASMVMPKITVPCLWVAATQDPSQDAAPKAFARLPHNPLNQLVKVDADHAGAPDASATVVLAWLAKVAPAN